MAHINGFGLQQLLEDHAIVGMLAGGNTNAMRLQCLANCSVAKDIVWRSRLFDEPAMDVSALFRKNWLLFLPRLDGCEFLHILDCLRDIPHLVGIDHEHSAGWTHVLPLELTTVGITAVAAGWEVLRVIDDRADDQATAEIRFDI